MDGALLSPFPHHSWLSFQVRVGPSPLSFHMRGVVHTVSLTVAGRHAIRQISGGRETRWTEDAGSVHFLPVDDEQRTFLTTAAPHASSAVLVIPRHHLDACLSRDGVEAPAEPRRVLAADDAVLRTCMQRLTAPTADGGIRPDVGVDEAARRLVLRLAELGTGRRPDWHDDVSRFTRRTLDHLVDHIDAHLRVMPTLVDMAALVGLSPSHFARKFRGSVGLSLQRFVNRRRLRAALSALRSGDDSLSGLALDLGFSSQSHFTRLFSDLTGMTPAQYRRQCRPTVG